MECPRGMTSPLGQHVGPIRSPLLRILLRQPQPSVGSCVNNPFLKKSGIRMKRKKLALAVPLAAVFLALAPIGMANAAYTIYNSGSLDQNISATSTQQTLVGGKATVFSDSPGVTGHVRSVNNGQQVLNSSSGAAGVIITVTHPSTTLARSQCWWSSPYSLGRNSMDCSYQK